jgi:DNA ligase (NAD+)
MATKKAGGMFSVKKLSEGDAANELSKLNQQILGHNELYYGSKQPVVTDEEYDKLTKRAKSIVAKYPSLSSLCTAIQNVSYSASVVRSTEQVTHLAPMLSLENAFNAKDIDKFVQRYRKFIDRNNPAKAMDFDFVVEPKIDGLSLALQYKHGILASAATRGNGVVGEDVTANAAYIIGVPHQISLGGEHVEVRGEVYISREDFQLLNMRRQLNNETGFSTPRNAAAGSLRLHDPKLISDRKLRFFAYDIIGKHIGAWHFCCKYGSVHALPLL